MTWVCSKWSLTLLVALILLVSTVTTASHAQTTTPAPTTTIPSPDPDTTEYLEARNQCLDQYRLGSVHIALTTEGQQPRVSVGEAVSIKGTITNTNAFPLTDGRLLVRVLRQDQRVAAEQWHPLIADHEVPGDFSLTANESKPFTFFWLVPPGAPSGLYRVEFAYLAGGRFSMAGLSFVPNFTAGSTLFTVTNPAQPTLVEFDRASVQLNGQALALRAVPPTLAAAAPLTVTATLTNQGRAAVPATVHQALYTWSDSDKTPPVQEQTSSVNLNPGTTPVTFTWPTTPGVYELVLTATPTDPTLLPSILKVRFPVAGNVPRLIFSGITGFEQGEAIVTSCAVNGTVGDGQGTLTTSALGQQANATILSNNLSATTLRVPLAQVNGDITIRTEARDDQGNITDQHEVTYSAALLPITPTTATPGTTATVSRSHVGVLAALGLVTVVVVAGISAVIWNRRRRKPPSLPQL